jgi:hypothetical protein
MPIYKNTKSGPLPVDTAEGDSLSVRGKGQFYVSRATELSPRFARLKTKKLVRFVKEDPRDKPRRAPVIQEAPATPPEPVPEVAPAPVPEPVNDDPASDSPGNVSTADESSASVAPEDAQPPNDFGSSDLNKSGAAEPLPGEGATDDDVKPKKGRYKKRRKKGSKSED